MIEETMEKDIQETEDSSQEPSTEGQETKIIEEDGEIYLRSDEEAPETDSDEEQSDPVSDVSSEESQENPVYKGKSREDILEMHLNAQQKITEQGEELGNLRNEHDTSLQGSAMKRSLNPCPFKMLNSHCNVRRISLRN